MESPCEDVFKGYIIAAGYMGWVPWYERYMLFDTEKEYCDYVNDHRMMKGDNLENETIKWTIDQNSGYYNDEGKC